MVDKKKPGGEEPQVNEITNFDDWISRVKKHVDFNRGEGRIDRFTIHTLTSEQVSVIRTAYNALIPAKPQPVFSKKGKPDPHFGEREAKYDEAVEVANEWLKFKYILEGWALPNGIEIPGKDEDEKITNMKKSIAGDASKLLAEIVQLSNIGGEDVGFF